MPGGTHPDSVVVTPVDVSDEEDGDSLPTLNMPVYRAGYGHVVPISHGGFRKHDGYPSRDVIFRLATRDEARPLEEAANVEAETVRRSRLDAMDQLSFLTRRIEAHGDRPVRRIPP